jgi:hypothetical protein
MRCANADEHQTSHPTSADGQFLSPSLGLSGFVVHPSLRYRVPAPFCPLDFRSLQLFLFRQLAERGIGGRPPPF